MSGMDTNPDFLREYAERLGITATLTQEEFEVIAGTDSSHDADGDDSGEDSFSASIASLRLSDPSLTPRPGSSATKAHPSVEPVDRHDDFGRVVERHRLEIETLKKESHVKSMELEETCIALRRQKEMLEAKLKESEDNYEKDFAAFSAKARSEYESVLHIMKELEGEVPVLKERAKLIKADLKDLHVSEGMYHELKAIDYDSLSPVQYAQIRVFEMVREHKHEVETLRDEVDMLKNNLAINSDELAKAQRQVDRMQLTGGELERELRADLDSYNLKCKKLETDLEEALTELMSARAKVNEYDKVLAEKQMYERNYNDTKNEAVIGSAKAKDLADTTEELKMLLNEKTQAIDIMRMDKEYLQKMNVSLEERCHRVETDNDKLSTKLAEAKKQRNELYERVMSHKDEAKASYEERLRHEVDKMQERMNNDLNEIRGNQKDTYDRECRVLRDAREQAIQELDRLKEKYKDLKTENDNVVLEFGQFRSTTDLQMNELKNAIKLKAFELERVTVSHEESMAALRQAKLENEMLQKKVEVLTQEYYQLQTENNKKISELEANLSAMERRMGQYDKLETELDLAIDTASKNGEVNTALAASGLPPMMPTTAERRIQHSIVLARQLLQEQTRAENLEKDLSKQRQKTDELARELAKTEQLLKQTQQPYNLLVETIRKREGEIETLNGVVNNMQAEMSALQRDYTHTVKEKELVKHDLERVIAQRANVDALRRVITKNDGVEVLSTMKQDFGERVKEYEHNHTLKAAPSWYQKLKKSGPRQADQ